MTVLHGDCRDLLATVADESINAIVTDPPYELGFMGKRWDASGIAYDATVWAECYRVLKPGGTFVAKVLRGGTERTLLDMLKKDFAKVRHVKPEASRADSAEMYVVGTGFRG